MGWKQTFGFGWKAGVQQASRLGMGWIIGTLFDFIWVGVLEKVSRRARPWVFALLLVAPLGLVVALLWLL